MIKLSPTQYSECSKEAYLKIIRDYLTECKGVCQKENLDDEDFNSPSWALKQAHTNGMIKMINKLNNFLPDKELS